MATRKRDDKIDAERFPLEIVVGSARAKIFLRDRRAEGKGLTFRVEDYASGRRRLRDFADLGKAKAEATRLATLVSSGQVHAASLDNADAASFGRAVALIQPTGDPIELVCARYAAAVATLGRGDLLEEAAKLYAETHRNVTPFPVAEAVSEYVGNKQSQGASTRYVQDLRHRLGKLAEAFLVDVDGVSTPALQIWLDGMKLGPQTMRNFRTVLSGFFGFCQSRGWCVANPVERLSVPKLKGGDEEPETFTVDEFAALLRASDPAFLPCLVLGGFCGLRSAEIERLHWEDVRLATGEIIIRRGTAKTKSRRIIPLCEAARQWLAPYVAAQGPIWRGTHEDFYEAQGTTAAAAGIQWKANGLRHGYASHRLALIGDAVRVATEMGNSPTVVHQHYKSLVSESDGKAWFAIAPASPGKVPPLENAS